MAAVTTVVDGNVKFREGKKWKNRWCVLKKPSPVADHLQLSLYKDVSEACKHGAKPKSVFTLDAFFGLEAEICVDKEQHVLAIVCLKNVFLLAFELRESMIRFEIKIRQSLGEERQFLVKVVKAPSTSKLPKDQLCLMIHDTRLCLTAQTPPKILMSWNVEDLRRFVAREDKFIFEGGARCGKASGLFALQCEQAADIADIINLASSGKMSNCHRKFKNRSSQIELGSSHLISPLPSPPSSSSTSPPSCQPNHHHHHHHYNNHHSSPSDQQQQQHTHQGAASKAPLHGALPTTLNCCIDNQTGSAESEDWSWYKRHSVSVTDHRRISALRDKSSVDGRDKMMLGYYDTPPNQDRQLEASGAAASAAEPMYDHPRLYANQLLPASATSNCRGNEHEEELVPRPEQQQPTRNLEREDEALANGIKIISLDGRRQEVDKTTGLNYNETLHRLKKQEYDLQREMVLLDEMLQSCTAESKSLNSTLDNGPTFQSLGKAPPKPPRPEDCQPNVAESYSGDKQVSNWLNTQHTEMPLNQDSEDVGTNGFPIPSNAKSEKSCPVFPQDFEIISGNVSSLKPNLMSRSGVFQKRPQSISARLNTSLPEGSTVSPLFHAKLNSIPQTSRLNAPLPYVNLTGYDDEAANHVHLPGSAENLPVTRGSSFHGLNSSQRREGERHASWRNHTGSTASLHLPTAVSSLTNLHQYQRSEDSHRRLQGRQSLDSAIRARNNHAHFMMKQAIEGPSFSNAVNHSTTHHEVLRVKMDPEGSNTSCADSSFLSSTKSLSFDASVENGRSNSDLVNALTVDSEYCNIPPRPTREDIYENLPVVKEDSAPPPLPPKGAALRNKLRSSRTNSQLVASPPTRHRPTPTLPPTKHQAPRHYGYDNDEPTFDPPPSAKTLSYRADADSAGSNYLEMGSPKSNHRPIKTVPLITPPVPERPSYKKIGSRRSDTRGDLYMAMSVADLPGGETKCEDEEEDEIYLDIDETCKPLEAYASGTASAENRERYVPVAMARPEIKESTYVEMAKMPSRKSLMLQNLETLQTYVSQKLGTEKSAKPKHEETTTTASAGTPIATTIHPPPRPPPLKIRHNSDSERAKKAASNIVINSSPSYGKPGKKSQMKVYTRCKAPDPPPPVPSSPNSEPPAPFTNLMEFAKKKGEGGKSPYLNTMLDADNVLVPMPRDFVPLPEPPRESFLSRLKRRSSKDRGVPPTPDKPPGGSNGKSHRNSALERSMSEHDPAKSARKEEKGLKVKIGRRRSSSFPNRLSFQEASDDSMPGGTIQPAESSCSFSSESLRSKPAWKKDRNHSFSSAQDYSDDSDHSPPVLKQGQGYDDSVTVLHAQRDPPFVKELYASQSASCLRSLSLDSSKTDDEKMIEMYQNHQSPYDKPSSIAKPVKDNTPTRKTKTGDTPYAAIGCQDEAYFNLPLNLKDATISGPENSGTHYIPVESNEEESYCNMDAIPKKSHNPRGFTLWVNAGITATSSPSLPPQPPPLPPKNKSYQALLSPVLESRPLVVEVKESPYHTVGADMTKPSFNISLSKSDIAADIEDEEEDDDCLSDQSDQYVELKGAGVEDEATPSGHLNSSSNQSKAGRESLPSTSSSTDAQEMNPGPPPPCCGEYTTISLSVAQRLNCYHDDRTDDTHSTHTTHQETTTTSPRSSPVLIHDSISVENTSISSDGNEANDNCVSPAKSVLRPRAGREYVVVRRIPPSLDSSFPPHPTTPTPMQCQSSSPSLSQVFDYDLHTEHQQHPSPSHHHQLHNHHHHQQHHPPPPPPHLPPYPCKSHHQNPHHPHNNPVSSCTSLSICSSRLSPVQPSPQPSPGLSNSTAAAIAQSQGSLTHDPWEKENNGCGSRRLSQPPLPRKCPLETSQSTLSSPSLSPLTPSSCRTGHSSFSHNAMNVSCPQSAPMGDGIFFPNEMAATNTSPSLSSHRLGSSDGHPIYVNQQFVDMYYSQHHHHPRCRVVSACSSSSSHSNFLNHGSHGQLHSALPRHHSNGFNSLGRNVRMRSGHSESEAIRSKGDKHLNSFSSPPSNHVLHHPSLTLTLPASVHRSHSDPKKVEKIEPRHDGNQNHIHRKEFDKFANSTIIARRRMMHPDSAAKSNNSLDVGQDFLSVSSPSVSTLEPTLSLQALSMRSSGYKNLDLFSSTSVADSPHSSSTTPTPTFSIAPSSSQLENIFESHLSPPSSDHRGVNPVHNNHIHNHYHHVSNSPPPLPARQRLVSTPTSSSPPLTPFPVPSDISDSPPPYDAPPPPPSLSRYRSESNLSSSSSEDDQELNYIEIDMSGWPCDIPKPVAPVPTPMSRQSKRARQQKKLAKLRYAEIDHTATKALQHTGQEHAQSRRGGLPSKSGSSLSRMNSAPVKGHKPLAVRERKLSTGSLESF